jgi:hypothetical protein
MGVFGLFARPAFSFAFESDQPFRIADADPRASTNRHD